MKIFSMHWWLGIVVFVTGMAINGRAVTQKILEASPDGHIRLSVSITNGVIYQVALDDKLLIAPSKIEPLFANGNYAWQITEVSKRRKSEIRHPVFGKRARVVNAYRELKLRLLGKTKSATQPLTIQLRVFNDGLALRYTIPATAEKKSIVISGEQTEFNFVTDAAWSWYRTEKPPAGPRKASAINGTINYPATAKFSENLAVALAEADLHHYPWAAFSSKTGQAGFTVARLGKPVSAALPFSMPWRVVMIGKTPAQLIDSDIIANLNPAADPDKYKWAKAGLCLWDWRAWGYKTNDGFTYGLNLPTWKRMIDFAAQQDIPYLLLDADWYGKEFSKKSNPFSGGRAPDVKKAIEYGRTKGVGLILYLNDVAARNYGIEKITKAFSDWGAEGIKYGFMRVRDRKKKVEWTHYVARLCAENHLMINFHDGPIPPTGEEATLPNFNTREYCHAQSDAHRAFLPGAFIRMAHVNGLAGPYDQDNGLFDLEKPTYRPRIFAIVYSTIVSEAARTLIVYSGLTVLPDAADVYRKHSELFRFIALQKQPWQESKTLSSDPSHWITVMRKSRDGIYLVGSVTDEHSRVLDIPLTFLPRDKQFNATIFSDGPKADYKSNRISYKVEKRTVTSKDIIKARLAPGGGHCMIIEP